MRKEFVGPKSDKLPGAGHRFRATFDYAPVGIMHHDLDGNILHVNAKLCEILGYPRDELLRLTIKDLPHPDHVGKDQPKYLPQMLAGKLASFTSERRYLCKEGTAVWVDRTVSLVRDASGKSLYFIRIIEDVTERRRAEAALRESERFARATIDALGHHICVIDADGRIIAVNEAWRAFACADGLSPEPRWEGTNYFEVCDRAAGMGARDSRAVAAGIRSVLAGVRERFALEYNCRCATELRWFAVKAFRFPGEGPLRAVISHEDITERTVSAQRRAMEHAVTRVLAESESVAEAMPQLIRTLCEAMDWVYGAHWVWNSEEENLIRAEFWCEFEPEFGPADRESWFKLTSRDAGGLLRRALHAKEASWIVDVLADRSFKRAPSSRKLGLRSAYAFPILAGSTVIGVMEFFGREVRQPDEMLLQITRAIGSQIGQFIRRKQAEAALRQSEEQFRQLATNIPQVFWICDAAQREAIYVSPAYENITGRTRRAVTVKPRAWLHAVHADDRRRVLAARKGALDGDYDEEYRIVQPDGSIRWVHDRAFPVHDADGRAYRIAGIAEDVTERKQAEERLMYLAHYDGLTSLPNRILFYDRLKQALAQAKRNQWTLGVMFIDLDRFKNVNDTLGHGMGDRLLQQVSERVAQCVRAGDTVGRLGGDEFAVVLSNLASAQDASLVAQKVMASCAAPFQLDGTEVYVTASIGITLFPNDSTDQDTLIRNADTAMYRAKEVGRNSYQFYMPEMNARALEKLSLESRLRRALERQEFLLYYQPRIGLATGKVTGVEALLRWQHPEMGLVPPADFMPMLEETGLIIPAGEWVIRAACAQIRAWQADRIGPVAVAVNLSARQFQAKDLGETVQRIVDESGIGEGLLEFEITESSLMHNTEEAAATLGRLKTLGIRVAIDDFGTGYSSLSYLKRFPLDALKVDRSFVRDVNTDADDAAITRAVIMMAHSLGLKVVAEGVETEAQLRFLVANGCDEVQGYYFARPLPPGECAGFLRRKHRLA